MSCESRQSIFALLKKKSTNKNMAASRLIWGLSLLGAHARSFGTFGQSVNCSGVGRVIEMTLVHLALSSVDWPPELRLLRMETYN